MAAGMQWLLLFVSLILGIAGAVLAAKVHPALFWVGWGLGLAVLGYFLFVQRRETADEPEAIVPATPSAPPAEDADQ